MKTVLVTGSTGFIGKNLCALLKQDKNLRVLEFNRNNTKKELEESLEKSDFVFHLAGVNRTKKESEFNEVNQKLTQDILSSLEKSGKKTPILITSSVQAALDNPYGRSKKAAEDAVFEWAKSTGTKSYIYRLPGVFGKWSRPNYNSVVATFCHNIANGLSITVNDPETELTLVYIDDVVQEFVKTLYGEREISPDGFYRISREFHITLKELSDILYDFKKSRKSLKMPDFENAFIRFLYATYTSYFKQSDFGYDLITKYDDRGWLAEFIKSDRFGQIFISQTKRGITRGNHWHRTKIEKFLVLDGEGEIKFRNSLSNKIFSYKVSGKKLKVLDIPAGYVHSIENVGKSDLLTIFWANEIFNPEEPDTYYEEV